MGFLHAEAGKDAKTFGEVATLSLSKTEGGRTYATWFTVPFGPPRGLFQISLVCVILLYIACLRTLAKRAVQCKQSTAGLMVRKPCQLFVRGKNVISACARGCSPVF